MHNSQYFKIWIPTISPSKSKQQERKSTLILPSSECPEPTGCFRLVSFCTEQRAVTVGFGWVHWKRRTTATAGPSQAPPGAASFSVVGDPTPVSQPEPQPPLGRRERRLFGSCSSAAPRSRPFPRSDGMTEATPAKTGAGGPSGKPDRPAGPPAPCVREPGGSCPPRRGPAARWPRVGGAAPLGAGAAPLGAACPAGASRRAR